MRISKDIYIRVVLAFYSTLNATNEDNTYLRSIIRSFKLNIFTSDIAKITNTPNEGIRCCGRDRWWEELGVSEAEVTETLTGNRGVRVRDIQISSLLTPINIYFLWSNTLCY